MSDVEASEWTDVVNRVAAWPPARRIALAKQILDSLPASDLAAPPPRRGLSAAEIQGLLAVDRPAPEDRTVSHWIDEHRMEKYGR